LAETDMAEARGLSSQAQGLAEQIRAIQAQLAKEP